MRRIPSLSYLAGTPGEALNGLLETVADVVADMQENGEAVPEPIATKSYSGKFQVRIPPEQHRNLAILAAEQGVSLNRLIASKLN